MDSETRDEAVRRYLAACDAPEHGDGFFTGLLDGLAPTPERPPARTRRSTAVAVVAGVVAVVSIGAAYAESRPGPRTVYVPAGQSVDLPSSEVSPGDHVRCLGTPAAGATVPGPGHGVGSSTGFRLSVASNGKTVRVTCPAPQPPPSSGGIG